MARDESIDNGIWDEPDFHALTPPAKLVYIWSWTNPRCHFGGIYQVPLGAISMETSYDESTVGEALSELENAEFVFYDGSWLFVKARVKRIRTRTVQMCKAIAKDLARVPNSHPYLGQLLDLQGDVVWQSKDARATLRAAIRSLTDPTADPQGSDPRSNGGEPKGRSHMGATRVAPMTRTRTETETLGGRGVGKGANQHRERDAEFEAAFPDIELAFVRNAARRVAARGEVPTLDAIRAEVELLDRPDFGPEAAA